MEVGDGEGGMICKATLSFLSPLEMIGERIWLLHPPLLELPIPPSLPPPSLHWYHCSSDREGGRETHTHLELSRPSRWKLAERGSL